MQRVLEVTSVDLSLVKTRPPQIHIVAHGTVPTSGSLTLRWRMPAIGQAKDNSRNSSSGATSATASICRQRSDRRNRRARFSSA